MKKAYLFLIISLLSVRLNAQQTISSGILHNGINRQFILYVPLIYNGSKKVPLLLNFHGRTLNATHQMAYGDFRSIADTAGFIIVHPEGLLDNTAQSHFNVGWDFGMGVSSTNDLGFTAALIDTLIKRYSIDTTRIYSTGFSNGGFMSFHLAC